MPDRSKRIVRSVTAVILFCFLCVTGTQAEESLLVEDNSAFAIDLYRKLGESNGNLFFSPYSISTALGMTYGGARGNTAKQMAKVLRFSLNQEDLHFAFSQLLSKLNKLQEAGNIRLNVANSLWPQQDYAFLDEYLSLVEQNYGVSIDPVDYKHAHENARAMINRWVEDKTQNKIKDLIQPGILNALTRLVLVNAIYFKGGWQNPFKTERTKLSPFRTFSGKSVQVPMMTQRQILGYADLGSFQMLEVPYAGNETSMIVILPKANKDLKQLETRMSTERLSEWLNRLNDREVVVYLPKFELTSTFRLDETLVSMGMSDAFNETKANFAGMDGNEDWLHIGAVVHKAFIEVNEEGTEAAAATAVIMAARGTLSPPPVFRADHPFLFLIHEKQTGSILFMGRVSDPTVSG